MKNFFLALLVFTSIITSCNDDKNNTEALQQIVNISESDLAHSWTLTEFKSEDGIITAESQGITITANLEITSKDYTNATTTFSVDPNEIYNNGSMIVTTKITAPILENGYSEEQEVISDPNIKGEWSASGNTLTLPITFLSFEKIIEAEITEYSENSLKLKAIISENIELPTEITTDLPIPIENARVDTILLISYTK